MAQQQQDTISDTDRMDWLESDTDETPNVRQIQFEPSRTTPFGLRGDKTSSWYCTLREAIDAAMKGQAEKRRREREAK